MLHHRGRRNWPLAERAERPLSSLSAQQTHINSSSLFASYSSFIRSASPLIVLFLASLLQPASGSLPTDIFYFQLKPVNNDVQEGGRVTLYCRVSDENQIEYRWSLNDKLIKFDGRRVLENSRFLLIKRADPDLDRGKFRCVARNRTSGFTLASNAVRINMYWLEPPVMVKLVKPAKPSDIVYGGKFELQCFIRSSTAKKSPIKWFHNVYKAQGEYQRRKHVQLLENGNLLVVNVSSGDQGVYRCFVEHPAGKYISKVPFILYFKNDSTYDDYYKPEHFMIYHKLNTAIDLGCPIKKQDPKGYDWFEREYFDEPEFKHLDGAAHLQVFCVNTPADQLLKYNTQCIKGAKIHTGYRIPIFKGDFHMRLLMCRGHSTGIGYTMQLAAGIPPSKVDMFPLPRPKPMIAVRDKNFTILTYQNIYAKVRNYKAVDPVPINTYRRKSSNQVFPTKTQKPQARVYVYRGRHLVFKRVITNDSGLYEFKSENVAGSHTIPFEIVVTFPPTFTSENMKDVTAKEGILKRIKCNVMTMAPYPYAKIVWYKNKRRIPATSRITEDQRDGILTIQQVNLSDEGEYYCAVDTKGLTPNLHKSKPFKLQISRALKILTTFEKRFLQRGSSETLNCVAQGSDITSMEWRRNKKPIKEMKFNKQLGSKIELKFATVGSSDAGKYMCVVTSECCSVNHTVEVIVGERPLIKYISSNLTVREGKSVILKCQATGDPKPTISWIKRFGMESNSKAESITNDRYSLTSTKMRRGILPNGSLVIRNAMLSDAAYYWCVAGNVYAMNSEKEVYLHVVTEDEWYSGGRDSSWSMTKTVIIVVGSAIAYLTLIIGLTVYCSLRMLRNRRKRAAWDLAKTEGSAPGGPNGHENGRLTAATNAYGESQGLMSAPDGAPAGPGAPHGDSRSHFSTGSAYTRSLRAGTPNGSLQDRSSTYPRHQLQTLGMLGKGEFGDVFLARAHNIREGESESLVVIKSHHNGRSDALDFEFHQQMDMFAKLDHDFVVKLLGVCREMEPEYMILEYCEWGDLKQFLKAMRQSDKENNERNVKIPPLTASQKVTMCSQVALGMEHLSNYRYIHKDLAARNVLLTSTLDLKIANLGLCQDVYAGEYFPMRNKRLPLRWLPAEVILEDAYSTKSDVWAFGILVYEVFTLGDIPHRRLTDLQVINAAESHYLLPELPGQCPAELASLLRQCWSDKPRERPSFNDISVIIGELTVDSDI